METKGNTQIPTATVKPPTLTREKILESEVEILKKGRESDTKYWEGRVKGLEDNLRRVKLPGVVFAAFLQWVITLTIGFMAVVLLDSHIRRLLINPTSTISMAYCMVGLGTLLGIYKWLQEKYTPKP